MEIPFSTSAHDSGRFIVCDEGFLKFFDESTFGAIRGVITLTPRGIFNRTRPENGFKVMVPAHWDTRGEAYVETLKGGMSKTYFLAGSRYWLRGSYPEVKALTKWWCTVDIDPRGYA